MNLALRIPFTSDPDALFAHVGRAWADARGGLRWPKRTAVNPARLGPALPHVCMVDVVAGAELDFRYRLCGQYLITQYGTNVSGMYQRALIDAVPDGKPILDAMLRVCESGEPQRFEAIYPNVNQTMRKLIAQVYPLSESGTHVDAILGAGVFLQVSG